MDSKNIYIVLAVVVVLAGGFFGYRHFSKGKSNTAHQEDTYKRLTEMAQKSPRAGLLQMGQAIKKYREDKNAYPENLAMLYPDYIQGRSFIDDVNWNYQVSGDNFLLSKGVERGGKTLVASIDATLKAKTGVGTLVASTGRKASAGSAASAASGGMGGLKLPSGMEILAALRAPDTTIDAAEAPEPVAPIRVEPRTVEVDETERPSEFADSVSRSYLVWRDAEGHMGYGNVQYPRKERVSIAASGNWVHITRRPDAVLSAAEQEAAAKSKLEDDVSSLGIHGNYLAWKNKNGVIGFGNVQLPDPQEIAFILVDGRWRAFEPEETMN